MTHLKNLPAPKTWHVQRKNTGYIVSPHAGPHQKKWSLPLAILLRDYLHLAQSMREVKRLLGQKEVLVDGIRRKDPRFPVGLFDVLSFPLTQQHYRVLFDKKGRLHPFPIGENEGHGKPCKIVGKTVLKGGKIQLNLYDGKNILAKAQDIFKVGDSLLLGLPQNAIQEVLPLQDGATVYFIRGKHRGEWGGVHSFNEKKIVYHNKNKEKLETARAYAFVIGKEKPLVRLE